jgi:hypothetical protein
MTELQIPQKTKFIQKYRKNWKEYIDRIPKNILKCQPKGKNKVWEDI